MANAGGDLFDRLEYTRLPEDEARSIMRQLLAVIPVCSNDMCGCYVTMLDLP
jgi:hypothetical protein